MAWSKVQVTIPDIEQPYKSGDYNYSNPSVKNSNVALIRSIRQKYGNVIKIYADAFGIPDGVIIGFIATESGGVMTKPNKFLATGLMQVTPSAVYDSVTKFKQQAKNPLPDVAVSQFKKNVPELLENKPFTDGVKTKILGRISSDAEFNICCGVTYLRWLLERFSNFSGAQLNKAMVGYNAGAYNSALGGIKANTSTIDSTLLAKNPKVPLESKAYLYKMLGVDGYLDLIYGQKLG